MTLSVPSALAAATSPAMPPKSAAEVAVFGSRLATAELTAPEASLITLEPAADASLCTLPMADDASLFTLDRAEPAALVALASTLPAWLVTELAADFASDPVSEPQADTARVTTAMPATRPGRARERTDSSSNERDGLPSSRDVTAEGDTGNCWMTCGSPSRFGVIRRAGHPPTTGWR